MARGIKFATDEERLEAARASAQRYRQSPKGQAARAADRAAHPDRDRRRYAENKSGRRDKMQAWNRAYVAKNKKPRKRLTGEELAAAQRAWSKRYRSSAKGKATAAAQRKAYFATAHGKAAAARYRENWRNRTEEQREARAAWYARWLATPTGRAISAASTHRRRAIGKISAATVRAVQRVSVCYYCGVGIETMQGKRYHPCRLTIDHLIPVARGGRNDPKNLAGVCSDCNSTKGAMTAAEFFELRMKGAS